MISSFTKLGILGGTSFIDIAVILLIIIGLFVLPIAALVKLLNNKSIEGGNKIGWVLFIIFFPIIGSIISLLTNNNK